MSDNLNNKDGKAVPSRRLSRLAGLGGMAVNIAGGLVVNGARQMASGQRPRAADLLMTPANAVKLTRQLSNMRGAAMKIGQMISMDSGDFLPKEFADILARLRADAQHMPRAQLIQVLQQEWGEGWESTFADFDYHPIAAASIGQVQRAVLPSGEELAIKVQYSGVKDSIDSDVKNVASLLRMSGVLPANMDVKPIIEAGRLQLHQEANYNREAAYLCRFREMLAGDENFELPQVYPDLSTDKVLTMSYIESQPIEAMTDAPQRTRDRIVYLLMDLTLRELFEFKLMQTDPNFANYRYNTQTDRLVLLDFGASRDIPDALAAVYQNLLRAATSGSSEQTFQAAIAMGFMPANMPVKYAESILEMMDDVIEPLSRDEPFDFGTNPLAANLRDKGMALALERELWHVPPAEMVFIQRKLGGVFMLASRLRARVNIHELIRYHTGA